MTIFDEVNSLPEELIARRLGLSTARDGKSFICPACGNGSGKTGDGIKQTKLKGKLVWHCYRCDGHWSKVEGISTSDSAELARKLEELFPEAKPFLLSRENLATKSAENQKHFFFSRESFSHFSEADRQASKSASRVFGYRSEGGSRASSDSRFQTSLTVPTPRVEVAPPSASEPVRALEPALEPVPLNEQKKLASEQEPKNYVKLYDYCRRNVAKFLIERGGSYRGLTAETFEKYGIVIHPEFGVEGQEKLPTLIIPYDEKHFVARAIDSGRRPTQHGQGAGLYEPLPIDVAFPTFIVEGELDALSVVQAVSGLGIRCVATGGASKYRKVVPELEKRFGNSEKKPSFIVMFDNDMAGKTNGNCEQRVIRQNCIFWKNKWRECIKTWRREKSTKSGNWMRMIYCRKIRMNWFVV